MADESLAEPHGSGIYEIVNTATDKRYIGSAVSLRHRWRQHRCELGKGRHNPHLQNSWNKHGEGAFYFRVIEYVPDKALLISREQHYIDTLKPEYNCDPKAGSRLGATMRDDSRKRVGEASKRTWDKPGYREKMSAAHSGYVFTDQHRKAISEANAGRVLSPLHIAKIAENNAARNRSEAHRARMSEYWKGRPKTPEQLAKMAATKRGSSLTEEHKRKVAESLRAAYLDGRRVQVISQEAREKIGRTLGKVADEAVRQIRLKRDQGLTYREISEAHALNESVVWSICNRKTYRWVA